jgi:hypothetical protein
MPVGSELTHPAERLAQQGFRGGKIFSPDHPPKLRLCIQSAFVILAVHLGSLIHDLSHHLSRFLLALSIVYTLNRERQIKSHVNKISIAQAVIATTTSINDLFIQLNRFLYSTTPFEHARKVVQGAQQLRAGII